MQEIIEEYQNKMHHSIGVRIKTRKWVPIVFECLLIGKFGPIRISEGERVMFSSL